MNDVLIVSIALSTLAAVWTDANSSTVVSIDNQGMPSTRNTTRISDDSSLDYLGQPHPGEKAVVFALGIVSNGRVHGRLEILPDGRDMFWTDVPTIDGRPVPKLMHVTRTEDGWTSPQVASFVSGEMSVNPLFSPDGNRLYFNSREKGSKGWLPCYSERTEKGWTESRIEGFMLNPNSSFTKSGRVYFTDKMSGKPWNRGTYSADYAGAAYENVQPLPEEINSSYIDYTSYISPDVSFLMFSSSRPSMEEDMYLYISSRNSDGSWSAPEKMNEAIGHDGNARFPSLSPDGQFLFFCGDDGNIYWVQSNAIDRLRRNK